MFFLRGAYTGIVTCGAGWSKGKKNTTNFTAYHSNYIFSTRQMLSNANSGSDLYNCIGDSGYVLCPGVVHRPQLFTSTASTNEKSKICLLLQQWW